MSGKALWLSLPRYREQAKAETPDQERRRYNARVRVWLALPENRWCAVTIALKMRKKRARQCHHKRGRGRGRTRALLMAEQWWVPVSAWGHTWIDANRAKARTLGLLCQIGEWNTLPKDYELRANKK